MKRPYNIQLIDLVRLVITEKSQTSALMYCRRVRSVNTSRPRGLRFACSDLNLPLISNI